MPPKLEKIVVNGNSRYRLYKGFLLLNSAGDLATQGQADRILAETQKRLQERRALANFTLERSADQPAVIHLRTPWLALYSVKQRDIFLLRLVAATTCCIEAADQENCQLVAAGVNPYRRDASGDPQALCADIHQVEVYDAGEVERIYNLYRQLLPELLAISTHSAVYDGILQKDHSLRMSVNLASYLPRYISQFSEQHLAQLERYIRKEYKLTRLSQMDVNPLGGDASVLRKEHRPLLDASVAAIELRFIDAQCSFPFIRAQILLIQAIAMYGRAMTRDGGRVFAISDESLDENKALALQNGGNAMLRPDKQRRPEEGTRSLPPYVRREPAVATTALLTLIEELLLPALNQLECEPWELYPLILGAELRRKNVRCFTNYAEYQHYLCQAYPTEHFTALLQQQMRQLLSSSTFDIICDYNRQLHQKLAQEIEFAWSHKLISRRPLANVESSEV